MKRSFLSLLLFVVFLHSFASGETRKSGPAYSVESVKPDRLLKADETRYVFTCFGPRQKAISATINYSFNGKEAQIKTDTSGKFSIKLKPGKYKFQFFINSDYEEIYTDSIEGKRKTATTVRLQFNDALLPVIADKPVIYLYPEKETNVSVKLHTEGQLLFTYPEYKNGWNVKANPDGMLTENGKTFSYLFWEGKTDISKSDIDFNEGFVVSSENLVKFFEEKLDAMALSSKEQQDFITYWVPRMKASENNYIHFLFNNEFDAYAHLDISPEPDNIFRVFMIWDPLEAGQQPQVKPQNIPSFTRNGFSVIEWGGSEINYFTEENN